MTNGSGPDKPEPLYKQVEAVVRHREELIEENRKLRGIVEVLEGKVQRLQKEVGGRYAPDFHSQYTPSIPGYSRLETIN